MIRRVTSALAVVVALIAPLGTLTTSRNSLASALAMTPLAAVLPMASLGQAAPYGCSIAVQTAVWVGRPRTQIPASLGSNCADHYATYASWNVRHATHGTRDIFIFDQKRHATNSFYDWEPYGTYYIEPRNSWSNFFDLTQNSRSYVVKSGSGISVSAARVGRYVALNLRTVYYSPQVRGYRAWPGARVHLQSRACATCVWKNLRVVRTGHQGSVTIRTYAAHTRYYRALASATPTIWGRTSTGIRR